MAKVELKHIKKVYDNKVTAIADANVVIEDKEFAVLVGPSGCGKSTMLRMIAGLEEISGGDLLIDGERVNDLSPKDRDIAMVFQNYALYPHMTVFDNMAFGLKLRKFPKDEIKKRVEHAAGILGLTDFLHRRPKAMSGGQRQRVAIGRAIVRQPKVFLFDEPLSNLDAKLRVQMRMEIKQLHKKLDATMIYVTHDQIEAMTMGNKIVVLKDGDVQQVDKPMTLYNDPANHFVGSFIGSPAMNFLKGNIEKSDRLYFKSDSISFSIPENIEEQVSTLAGKAVTLGFRPESIYDHDYEDRAQLTEKNAITIDVTEPVGAETFVYFTAGETELCMRSSSGLIYENNQEINIGFDVSRLYFFDPESGKRLV